jgi:membrane-associated protease RseP (regulator of RpoE activity)
MRYAMARLSVCVAAALVGLLQILSLIQMHDHPYSGYRTDTTRVVNELSPGGPAAQAGIRIGDRIIRIGGVAADDTRTLRAQPRARIGESREIVVERDGRQVVASLTYGSLPAMDMVGYLASSLTGICFLGFGVWAMAQIPRASTTLLALAGIGLGATFVNMPYFDSPTVRDVQEALLVPAAMFGFVFLLHFTLVFPAPKRLIGHSFALPALYGPPVLVAVGYLLAAWWGAGLSDGPRQSMTTAALIVVMVAFASSVAALVHGYVTTGASFRSAWGLNALLVCMVLGLAPIVPTAIALVAPRVALPGAEYYDVVWVLIPFALARAAVRQARTTALGQPNGENALG